MQNSYSRRIRFVLATFLGVLIFLSIADSSLAQSGRGRRRRPPVVNKPPASPGLWGKNMVGGLLGPWFSDNLSLDIIGSDFSLKSTTTTFHLELFYQPHLTGILYLDLNFGAVSRGDIRITSTSTGESAFGNASIYPLGAGVLLVPLAKSTGIRLQPFFRAGGSLLVGTERLQVIYQDPVFGSLIGQNAETRLDVGFYAGAGVLWVLGSKFALTGSVKYQHAKFRKELFGVKDYSGIQVLIGGTYLYH